METNQREREMRRRREEQRRAAQRRNGNKIRRSRKGKKIALLFMLCMLLIGSFITGAFTVFFPIKTVTVEGNLLYTKDEILSAASIEEGSNLLRLNPQSVISAVRARCPYISEVALQRKLPGRVILTVTESGPAYAFAAEDHYILVTNRYELIEESLSEPEGMIIYGVSVAPKVAGQPVSFNDSAQKEALDMLLTELAAASITQITKIDLTDLEHVRLQYGTQHIWKLGSLTNLPYKLRFGAQISKQETGGGSVDLSGLVSGKSGYFKSEVLGAFMPDITATDVASGSSSQ